MKFRSGRIAGCLWGLACGDAVGTTLEFKARGSFEPITDMVGGGPFELRAGEWTDDTSMALCLATSLVDSEQFDPRDQIERYGRWHREGYLSSNGRCFDIGGTVSSALRTYALMGNPFAGSTDEFSAGNGSIMRLAPVPMYYADWADAIHYSGESSRTTHGAAEAVGACRLFGSMLHKAIGGASKDEVLFGAHFPDEADAVLPESLQAIGSGVYRSKTIDDIRGSGYVVDCFEAALWCFYQTDSYQDAVLAAANLGDDADTTAAVCGQVAGAYYGLEGIPVEWRQRLAKSDIIESLSDALQEARG